MAKVDRVKTSLTRAELVLALRDGYLASFQKPPSVKALGVAFAQNALENAWGQAIWNNNFGNVTAGKAWKDAGKDYYTLHVAERLDPKNHPDKWTEIDLDFRAYPVPAAGAKAYWDLLGSPHYASVLPIFGAGDAKAAAYRLSELGYFTAHVEDTVNSRGDRVPGYASNMVAIYQVFTDHILPNLPPMTEPATEPVCVAPDTSGDAMRCLLTADEVTEVLNQGLDVLIDLARDLDLGPSDGNEDPGASPGVA